jgi:LemA protein
MSHRIWRLVAVFAAAATLGACGMNDIPTQRETARARWGDVQSTYQRRADLIPNLVNTVQAAAGSERVILRALIQARASATQDRVAPTQLEDPAAMQRYAAAQNTLGTTLSRLLVVTENYPQLQSNQGFRDLQVQLEGTENRINVARRDYNEAVRSYNTTLSTFPGSLWASTFYSGNRPMQPFAGTAASQTAPSVNFNIPGVDPNAPAGSNTTTTTTNSTTATTQVGAPPSDPAALPPGQTQ